jgi:hypothetical protein
VPPVSQRLALGALTLVGVVLAATGLWFSSHLGLSGSASFTARPSAGRVVVLEPSVLNRVDAPVTITATAPGGGEVWIGRAAPSDAKVLLGGAARSAVTGVSVSAWGLRTAPAGVGAAPALAQSDVWHQSAAGKGRARLTLQQQDAPETVVVATGSGRPAALDSLRVTWQRGAWAAEALTLLLLGIMLAAAGVAGLWLQHGRTARRTDAADVHPAADDIADGTHAATDADTDGAGGAAGLTGAAAAGGARHEEHRA